MNWPLSLALLILVFTCNAVLNGSGIGPRKATHTDPASIIPGLSGNPQLLMVDMYSSVQLRVRVWGYLTDIPIGDMGTSVFVQDFSCRGRKTCSQSIEHQPGALQYLHTIASLARRRYSTPHSQSPPSAGAGQSIMLRPGIHSSSLLVSSMGWWWEREEVMQDGVAGRLRCFFSL